MDWKDMLHMTPSGISGMARHWARSARAPVRTTSGSFAMKTAIRFSAAKNPAAAKDVIRTTEVLNVKKKAFPAEEHCYRMLEGQQDGFRELARKYAK